MTSSTPSTEPPKISRLRTWLIQFILVVAALLLSFGIVEIGLRLFPGVISMPVLFKMDPSIREKIAERVGLPTRHTVVEISPQARSDGGPPIYIQRPNASLKQYNEKEDIEAGAVEVVRMDGIGFCNPPGKARRGKADVMVVGDSFTFCTSVEPANTAAGQMEEMSGLAVYNIGIGGVGPDAYLELLKKFAPRFQPKVAVMNIYEGNDLRDLLVTRASQKSGRPTRKAIRSRGWMTWSYSVQFVIANMRLAKVPRERKSRNRNINFRYSAPVGEKIVAMNLSNKDDDEVRNAIAIRDKKISFEEFRAPLVEFVKWSNENNIVPIVTYIPSMYSVYEGSVTFQDPKVGSAVQAFSAEQRKWFATEAGKIGFHFRDMTPAFQQAAQQGVLTHFPGNVHLTQRGHEVVARQSLELIRQVSPLQ